MTEVKAGIEPVILPPGAVKDLDETQQANVRLALENSRLRERNEELVAMLNGGSLREAQVLFRGRLDADPQHMTECPCCGRGAKVYRRQINHSMVVALAYLAARDADAPGGWVNLPLDDPTNSRDTTRLALWGLIEEERAVRDDGGRVGNWRITERGHQFIHGQIVVPKYAVTLFGERIGYDDEQSVMVADCYGEGFDLADLMSR